MSNDYRKFMGVACLPPMPESITPLCEDSEVESGMAIVFGGLSILGDEGYVCPTVTLLIGDQDKELRGWSLCINNPHQKEEDLYYFETSKGTFRGTEIPNYGFYFQAMIDPTLIDENADKALLEQVIAYVLPHISDEGAPPPCTECETS